MSPAVVCASTCFLILSIAAGELAKSLAERTSLSRRSPNNATQIGWPRGVRRRSSDEPFLCNGQTQFAPNRKNYIRCVHIAVADCDFTRCCATSFGDSNYLLTLDQRSLANRSGRIGGQKCGNTISWRKTTYPTCRETAQIPFQRQRRMPSMQRPRRKQG